MHTHTKMDEGGEEITAAVTQREHSGQLESLERSDWAGLFCKPSRRIFLASGPFCFSAFYHGDTKSTCHLRVFWKLK